MGLPANPVPPARLWRLDPFCFYPTRHQHLTTHRSPVANLPRPPRVGRCCRPGDCHIRGTWAGSNGAVRPMFWLCRVLWKTRGGPAGRSDRLCEKVHVAKRQHAKCEIHKKIGRPPEIALTKRNMGIVVTSSWHTMLYEICGSRRRIACCRSSTCHSSDA